MYTRKARRRRVAVFFERGAYRNSNAAIYCKIIKYAIGTKAASEFTLFGQVYDLEAASRMGVVQKTVAPEQFLDTAVAWAAHVTPDCYAAYSYAKRALQAATMSAIDTAARLDLAWLSRGMSDPKKFARE